MPQLKILKITQKYLRGKSSPVEQKILVDCLAQSPKHRKWFKQQVQLDSLLRPSAPPFYSQGLWQKIQRSIDMQTPSKKFPWIWTAAAVLALVFGSYFWHVLPSETSIPSGIVLKIENGMELHIDPLATHPIFDPLGNLIAKQENRLLIWEPPTQTDDPAALLEAIRIEKLKELGTESGIPWIDMVRYAKLDGLNLNLIKPTITQEFKYILPIPGISVERGVVVQNPGY